MSNVLEFKRRTPVDENQLVVMEQFNMGAMAMLMDVRTQLNCIQNSLPSMNDTIKEVRLDRLINTLKGIFESVILPFDVPASVWVRYESNDDNAQSILVTIIDLERASNAVDISGVATPNMRVEIGYLELDIGEDFERSFVKDDLLHSKTNKVPECTLHAIRSNMEKVAIANNGTTRMMEDRRSYLAYIPFSLKYTIVITLQSD